jgi:hypothetical protein
MPELLPTATAAAATARARLLLEAPETPSRCVKPNKRLNNLWVAVVLLVFGQRKDACCD